MRRGQRAAAPRRPWLRGRRGDDTSRLLAGADHPGDSVLEEGDGCPQPGILDPWPSELPDEYLDHQRGQHLVTTNPGISQFTEVDTGDSPDLIAIYPHEGHLVLGGTAEPGLWDREPSPQTAAAILARCTAIEPRLRTAQIIGHRVGLRPTRDEVRLEEQPGTGHARVIHSYGHGGAGVSLAWGCALEVAAVIDAPA